MPDDNPPVNCPVCARPMESAETLAFSDGSDADSPTSQADLVGFTCSTHGLFLLNEAQRNAAQRNATPENRRTPSDDSPKTVGPSQVEVFEEHVTALAERLAQAKSVVQGWADKREDLFTDAAKARAENQNAGRGSIGIVRELFGGAKYRAALRKVATVSNARIAQEVAEKRAQIADGKREAQAVVKELQQQLLAAKSELKAAKARAKHRTDDQDTVVAQVTASLDQATASLALLQKLKDAKDAGLLSEAEFEEKRRKLLSMI